MSTIFAPVNPTGAVLGDEVFSVLAEAIVDGRLPAGERLRDQDLARRLGVSRTPVREALQRLERTGLVEVAPHRYTRVSIPSDRTLADTLEYWVYLLGNALQMALRRCSDERLAETVELTNALIEASLADEQPAIVAASNDLFAHVVADTGNTEFQRLVGEAWIAVRRNLASTHPYLECRFARTAAYEQFRDAVAARDGRRAEQLLREINGIA